MPTIDVIYTSEKPYQLTLHSVTTVNDPYRVFFHAHHGLELLIVHEGEGTLMMNETSYPVGPGTLLLFQPFQLHSLQMRITENRPYAKSMVLFEPSFLEPYVQAFPHLAAFLRGLIYDEIGDDAVIALPVDNEIAPLLRDQKRRTLPEDRHAQEEDVALFIMAFLRAIQPYFNDNRASDAKPARQLHRPEQIMTWIEDHYTHPFELAEMASDLHVSPYHLSHLFREKTGSTISDYVKARRIRQACLLLSTSRLAVTDIALNVGFQNISYFCKSFKAAMGVTPYQYRLRHNKST